MNDRTIKGAEAHNVGADFVCAGMFDYQVVEDANILTGILDNPGFKRKRDWIA